VRKSLTRRSGVNHGTFLHIAHEEGLVRNTSIHAGIRGPLSRRKGDMKNDVRCGFDTITARELDRITVDGVIRKLKDRVGDSPVYISVDIDVLDPAFAPGKQSLSENLRCIELTLVATGTAEPGGWTTRELLSIIDGLVGMNLVGADVGESL
jgi:agmatinase